MTTLSRRTGRSRLKAATLAMFCVGVSGPAAAVDIMPYVSLSEYYSNNLFLQPDPVKKSDWVTNLRPGITVASDQGTRLTYSADYAYEALFYLDHDENDGGFNHLNANAFLDLLGEELTLFGSAEMTQVNIQPEGRQTDSNVPVTGNRSDSNTIYGGPRWRRQIFGGSEIRAHYYIGRTSFDTPAVQDVKPSDARAVLQNADPGSKTRYRLAYNYSSLDYQRSNDVKTQDLFLELATDVGSLFALTGMVGTENDLADSTDNSLSEGKWSVGVQVGTSDENKFSASVGHRYFGTTYRVTWDRVLPNRSYRLAYNESPSNSDFLRIQKIATDPADPDNPLPPPNPLSDLDRPGVPGRFINKRLDARASFIGNVSSLTLTVYGNRRESLLSSEFDAKSHGVVLGFDRSMGARTMLALSGTWKHRGVFFDETAPGSNPVGADDQYRFIATMNRSLGQKTNVSLSLQYDEREDETNAARDYDAFLISLGLSRVF